MPATETKSDATVYVKEGDAIIRHLKKGGSARESGGWFKAGQNEDVSPTAPVKAIALESFSYDPAVGRRYHSVKFRVTRRWLKNRDVGGEPGPVDILTQGVPEQTTTPLPSGMIDTELKGEPKAAN